MGSWLERIAKALRQVTAGGPGEANSQGSGSGKGASQRHRKLVVSRPTHLPQDYQMSFDQSFIDEVFQRLRESIFRNLDEGSVVSAIGQPGIFREFGETGGKTPYFYLKPLNEKGWLFERSGSGWVVTRAEKIVGEDLFLRGIAPWDVANLFSVQGDAQSEGSRDLGKNVAVPRVMSRVLGKELLSIPVYQHKLLRELELSPNAKPYPVTDLRTSDFG